MFETSADSGWLVELYGREVRRPAASSLIPILYHQLPNDTDLSVLLDGHVLYRGGFLAGLDLTIEVQPGLHRLDWREPSARNR